MWDLFLREMINEKVDIWVSHAESKLLSAMIKPLQSLVQTHSTHVTICKCQALGCLLFRICYFKSAFDGESKLQVLNGNYRIPDMPKYSSLVLDLIRDMLQARPDDRPDITQASALLDWPFISMNLGWL